MKYTIIGNSGAAISAVKAIRKLDTRGSITVITREKCRAYSPVLGTYLISGRISSEGMYLVDKGFYYRNKVELITGEEVTAIDSSDQKVLLKSGNVVNYEKLLIATGATPLTVGPLGNRIKTLRTVDDARKIKDLASKAKEIVIVGAGLLGLQLAEAIRKNFPSVNLKVVEADTRVLPRYTDSQAALLVETAMKQHNVSFINGCGTVNVQPNGEKVRVVNERCETIVKGDIVISGIGVKPNVGLVRDSPISVNRGIIVDSLMKTNVNNIYAAGDVTETFNPEVGSNEISATWLEACEQGRIAGYNMAGWSVHYSGCIQGNITTVFGLCMAFLGDSSGLRSDNFVKSCYTESGIYRRINMTNSKFTGATLIGRWEDVGVLYGVLNSTTIKADVRKLSIGQQSFWGTFYKN